MALSTARRDRSSETDTRLLSRIAVVDSTEGMRIVVL